MRWTSLILFDALELGALGVFVAMIACVARACGA